MLQLKYLELFKLAYLQKARYYSDMDDRRPGANEGDLKMTKRNAIAKSEKAGAIAFIIAALIGVVLGALVAFSSGVAFGAVIVVLSALAAFIVKEAAAAIVFKAYR